MLRFAIPFAAVAALALPAVAPAATIHGTVVHRIAHAHAFVVATKSGSLRSVHSTHRPRVGRVVAVQARSLANGTFSASHVGQRGLRRHARLRGTITHLNRRTHTFVLSAHGTSLLVRAHRRSLRAAAADTPAVGDTAVVDATLTDGGDVEADDVQVTGQTSTYELEGVVQSVGADTLTISADDEDETGATLTVAMPDGTTGYRVGDEVELVVTRDASGNLTAVRGSSDDEQGDDDQGENEHEGGDRTGGTSQPESDD